MATRKTRPTSPGRRFATYQVREELTGEKPEKSLTEGTSKSGGRNSKGRVTSRHRGGGAKRRYRRIDFKRRKDGVPARVASIEYDPNRTTYIALLNYADGTKSYILAPQGLQVGAEVSSGPGADIRPGQRSRAALDSDGDHRPRGGNGPGTRSPHGPRCRRRDSGGREGGPDGQPATAVG